MVLLISFYFSFLFKFLRFILIKELYNYFYFLYHHFNFIKKSAKTIFQT